MTDHIVLPQGYYLISVAFASSDTGSGARTVDAVKYLGELGREVSLAHISTVRRRLVSDEVLKKSKTDGNRYSITPLGRRSILATASEYAALAGYAAPLKADQSSETRA